MDAQPPSHNTPKPSGLPIWTALIALLILALVGVGALVAIWHNARSDKAKLQRQIQALENQRARDKVEEGKATEQAKLAVARTRQEEVLAQARNATNVLTRLLKQANQVMSDAVALSTNEMGRSVALHPDLVTQARRLFEVNLPSLAPTSDVISRLEAARRIEQQLVDATGTTFEPTPDLMVTTQNSALWSEQELRKVAEAQTLLSGLIQESRIKVAPAPLTPNSPTLQSAISQAAQAELATRQRTIVEKTTEAKGEAADTIAKAEAQRIIEEARIQASNVLAQANEVKAQQQREAMVRTAEGKVQDSKAKVEAVTKEDEARKIELRKKASEPEIQTKLAPFITPGYWQPGTLSTEKKAYSYNQLQGSGALDSTKAGLQKLAHIATDPRDKLRPRWKLGPNWLLKPEQLEKVKEAQQLLTELGPVLVEMNLLEP